MAEGNNLGKNIMAAAEIRNSGDQNSTAHLNVPQVSTIVKHIVVNSRYCIVVVSFYYATCVHSKFSTVNFPKYNNVPRATMGTDLF